MLEPAWWSLWRRCPVAPPFVSPAWCLPWAEVFAPGPLRVAAVWQGATLVGLAPHWREDGPLGVRLLPLGVGISDALDVLVDPDAPEVGGDLVEILAGADPDLDRLEFEELGEGATARMLVAPPGMRLDTGAQSASPVLDLTGDEFGGVPAAKRRKLRMARHRAARRDAIVRTPGPNDTGAFLDDLARLHGARWIARGEHGVLAEDRVLRFHRAALPRLVAADLARLFTLEIAGRVAGAYYGLAHAGRAYAYLGGFDPDFAFESPGTVLMGHAIERAQAEGCRALDFLRGQEPYKYAWGAVDAWSVRRSFVRDQAGV